MTSSYSPALRRSRWLPLVAAVLMAGCVQAPKSIYYWGSYQSTAYDALRGDVNGPAEQLRALEEQAQKAQAAGLPLPPGYYGHLGLVYMKLGRPDDARKAWQTESERFPESAPYIDSLIKRLDAPKS